ncbi:phage portal protein [Pontibaca methylaminivorans]|uniref:phage portal protein n=1 Tax=Pontibaca methylaminivorans TaxID=515897 RepID=UPI002E11ADB7
MSAAPSGPRSLAGRRNGGSPAEHSGQLPDSCRSIARKRLDGVGIEQPLICFVAYALENHLTMWEEAIDRDLIGADDLLYARFNRAALVKGDIKARWEAYVKGLQWGS